MLYYDTIRLCILPHSKFIYELQKKLPINGPFNGAPVPVEAPCTPRSGPVQARFAIIGSPVRVLCGLPVFCTAEFLARAKLKSKAKKTTEKLGSTQKSI